MECLILIPFGSPVDPEVNKRQAARLSLILGCLPVAALTGISLCWQATAIFLSISSPLIERIETEFVILGNSFSMTLVLVGPKINT